MADPAAVARAVGRANFDAGPSKGCIPLTGDFDVNDWMTIASRDRRVLAEEVKSLQGLDDRIRDAMDGFDYSPHTQSEDNRSCVPCLLIELNKALLPGWSPPDGHATVRPHGS